MSSLLLGGLGTPELILIFLVVMLLFGASKLPDLARGSGRALRIFKAETKGLTDDDVDDVEDRGTTQTPQRAAELVSRRAELDARQAVLDAERARLRREQS
ncbi:Sec-independent protein translocase subunit TatA [Nocardioides sp. AN3]